MKAGVAYVTEDKKGNGLFLSQNIKYNITISNLETLIHGISINENEEVVVANRFKESLNIKAFSISQIVENLSGGNQQKVSLAKWLFANPKVLILDEPTKGIDVGAKYEIYTIMNRLVEQLLFLARGDSGRNPVTFQPFDLSATLGEVCDEYKMIDSAHVFTFKSPGAVNVTGDESLIKQAARILMDNASKYTGEDGRIIDTLESQLECRDRPARKCGFELRRERRVEHRRRHHVKLRPGPALAFEARPEFGVERDQFVRFVSHEPRLAQFRGAV